MGWWRRSLGDEDQPVRFCKPSCNEGWSCPFLAASIKQQQAHAKCVKIRTPLWWLGFGPGEYQ